LLDSLLQEIKKMMALEKEFRKINFRNLFFALELKELDCDQFAGLTTLEADSCKNKTLNRYYNVVPYDQTRVKVSRGLADDYINANYVNVPDADRKYILTQGPLEETVDHFWLMCHQVKTSCIVMLCRCYENARELMRDKSAQYWPSQIGEVRRTVDGIEIKLLKETETKNFIIRELRLTHTSSNTNREIKQLHYVNWPDFNVPDSPDSFLDFLETVRETGCFGEDVGPPIVHCSAGIGRSGTFCLVDSCLVIAAKDHNKLGLPTISSQLLHMRAQRKGLIQTEDQLKFSVSAIISGVGRLPEGNSRKAADASNGTHEPLERAGGKRASGSTTPPSSGKKRKNSENS